MSNHNLRDKNLSYKAKGMLSYMLSLPDDWDYRVNGSAKVSKEQIKAIRSVIKELEENHYIERNKRQRENGTFYYDYNIYEYPYNHNGHTVYLSSENRSTLLIENGIVKILKMV